MTGEGPGNATERHDTTPSRDATVQATQASKKEEELTTLQHGNNEGCNKGQSASTPMDLDTQQNDLLQSNTDGVNTDAMSVAGSVAGVPSSVPSCGAPCPECNSCSCQLVKDLRKIEGIIKRFREERVKDKQEIEKTQKEVTDIKITNKKLENHNKALIKKAETLVKKLERQTASKKQATGTGDMKRRRKHRSGSGSSCESADGNNTDESDDEKDLAGKPASKRKKQEHDTSEKLVVAKDLWR